jgi:predicted deacylase
VGFVITVKPGDAVEKGDPVASVVARDEAGIAAGLSALGEAIVIGVEGRLTPLITHRLTSRGAEVTAGAG